ncbi:MAG: DEAD/DEAH box helicase [Hyphomicrobiaceae bacterium]|nr:DEAD/DEAH box helicase [Hyphomicrobiaceae bacterium]
MTQSTFAGFGLPNRLVRSLEAAGFITPTPIQEKAIPAQLQGRDVLGIAQTGSGKTAAFSLPILTDLMSREGQRTPRSVGALILAPTRELAVQINDMIRAYVGHGHLTTALVLGGMSRQSQINKLARGVDVLVATPGRLCDLLDDRKVRLDLTRHLVLDEADRMLDMGFIAPIRKIAAACAPDRQTVMFSATMPPEIAKLASSLLKDPVRVEAAPHGATVGTIEQTIILSGTKHKRSVLNRLLEDDKLSRVIVFARTKHGADKVARDLDLDGHAVAAIHGNKSQNARQSALRSFRDGDVRLLVATDIAARGIDVPDISHVINFDLPDEAENYVHRIGRTGRNGASGLAISLVDGSELRKLRDVERLIRKTLPRTGSLPDGSVAEAPESGGRPGPNNPRRGRKGPAATEGARGRGAKKPRWNTARKPNAGRRGNRRAGAA